VKLPRRGRLRPVRSSPRRNSILVVGVRAWLWQCRNQRRQGFRRNGRTTIASGSELTPRPRTTGSDWFTMHIDVCTTRPVPPISIARPPEADLSSWKAVCLAFVYLDPGIAHAAKGQLLQIGLRIQTLRAAGIDQPAPMPLHKSGAILSMLELVGLALRPRSFEADPSDIANNQEPSAQSST
jgi:hypothetical protein